LTPTHPRRLFARNAALRELINVLRVREMRLGKIGSAAETGA
jgi:hypothetical protein